MQIEAERSAIKDVDYAVNKVQIHISKKFIRNKASLRVALHV